MILTSLSPVQCAKSSAGCSDGRATAGPRQCYEVTLLWCSEQSRRQSIVSISSLESFPSVRDLLAPRAPPEVAGPPPAMPETVAPPAAAITVPNQLPTRLINVKSQRPSPGTSAQLHARRARNRHCCQTQWPCAQAQTAQLKVVIGDQIVVTSSQPRPWQSFV
jgi:hypothetical protein